ncbi:MAG: HIT domain-containing protein [Acidiferrobacterales bacterium]|nr:HIT domain-containing protein [Acidiferrobacterales bacterium]
MFQLNGAAAGQTVPHIHFHILPGSYASARAHASVSAEQSHLESIAEKIRNSFS